MCRNSSGRVYLSDAATRWTNKTSSSEFASDGQCPGSFPSVFRDTNKGVCVCVFFLKKARVTLRVLQEDLDPVAASHVWVLSVGLLDHSPRVGAKKSTHGPTRSTHPNKFLRLQRKCVDMRDRDKADCVMCRVESGFGATGLVQQGTGRRGFKEVTTRVSRVVPELRFALCAHKRMWWKRGYRLATVSEGKKNQNRDIVAVMTVCYFVTCF